MISSPLPASWVSKKTLLGVAGSVATVGVFMMLFSGAPKPLMQGNIPLPFGAQESNLQGKVTPIGKRNGIDVYEVTYRNAEKFEVLLPDRIYLVHIPNIPDVLDVPLDTAMAAVTGSGRFMNYYGYRYSDAAATMERRDIAAILFQHRFPGQFFASAKARAEDVAFGNQLIAFEQQNNVTFLPTNGTAGSVRMDPAGALYVFIVNEENGARLFARNGGMCGNAILEPGEDCDDADGNDNNACTNSCHYNIPIPFGSGSTATGAKMAISVQTVATSGTVRASQTGVTLLRFDAGAAELVRLTKIVATTQTGSLADAQNFKLMRDSNNDGRVDTVVQSGVSPVSGTLTFDALNGVSGQLIGAGAAMTFEIVADIAPNVPSGHLLQLKLSTATSGYVAGRRENPAVLLSGIRTDAVCAQAVCQIAVTTRPSILWTITNPPVCGNGIIQSGEACDDADVASGDGCSATCAIESGYTCSGAPSMCSLIPSSGSSADLLIVSGALPATGTGAPLEDKVLLRFTATASGESIDLHALRMRAVTGSGTAMSGFKLKKDTNGDSVTDAVVTLASIVRSGSSDVTLTVSGSNVVTTGSGTIYEVIGSFVDTPQDPVKFAFASANTPFATAQTYVDASIVGEDALAGIETNGTCTTECDIHVTLAQTTLFTQVDLHGSAPECGDGVIAGTEVCDDGDTDSGDGCSNVCAVEAGYSCTGEPSVCTPDPVCGNGNVESGEDCDDGNSLNTDACTNVCELAVCGDTFIQGTEECDDGNSVDTDDCDNSCNLTTPTPSF